MKNKFIAVLLAATVLVSFSGCSEVQRKKIEIEDDANNFKIARKIQVINLYTGEITYEKKGKFRVNYNDDRLELLIKERNDYRKTYISLNENVQFIIQDLDDSNLKEEK